MNRLYKDIGMRGTGKSTRLLKKAVSEGCDIATVNKMSVRTFVRLAQELGYSYSTTARYADIEGVAVAPISDYVFGTFNRRDPKRPVLIDELGLSMAGLLAGRDANLAGYTESIEGLEGQP